VITDGRIDRPRRCHTREMEELVVADDVDELFDAQGLIIHCGKGSENSHEAAIATILDGEITGKSVGGD
jgi:hypothetical protein